MTCTVLRVDRERSQTGTEIKWSLQINGLPSSLLPLLDKGGNRIDIFDIIS